MRRLLPRRLPGTAGIALGAALLAACGGAQDGPAVSTLTVVAASEQFTSPYWTEQFVVFSPLVWWEPGGRMEGRLAARWAHSPDHRTWTYHLRPGLVWHDGAPVTAHDVKFSLELMQDSAILIYPPGSAVAEVLDDSTVRVHYADGAPLFDNWNVVYPRHLLEGLDRTKFWDWDFWRQPVGTGPYRYVRHVPQTMMELEANPDYFDGRPAIDRLVLKFAGAPVVELLSGDVDLAGIPGTDLLKLQSDPRFRAYHGPPSNPVSLLWNQRAVPAFRDVRVRRALTLAIDRRELLRVMTVPERTPVVDGAVWGELLLDDGLPEPLPFDPRRAAALLAEAGWRDADGDGIRERDGEPLRFSILTWEAHQRAAVYLQSQLRRVGAQVELEVFDRLSTVSPRINRGDYEAALAFGPQRPESFEEGSAFGYVDPRVAGLMRQYRTTLDPAARRRIRRETAEILQVELPMTTLYPLVQHTVAARRVRGLESPIWLSPRWERLRLEESN